ncbi:MAG: helix-turn-helix domain-containing protein [Tannerellaceae bacterium]|nr:helix-turn-helix domain-containing protein [Tannerellaceae bacterium]
MAKIGKNIKKIRNVRGLSQQAFADLFGLTRGNISSYEELRADPKIEIVVRIANYFGIPLAEFIENDLSVNDLLHYNTRLVLDANKLKIAQQLLPIPYLPTLYLQDYIIKYKDADFIRQLPTITVPTNSKLKQLAIEVENADVLPAGFDFSNGDILICEEVVKENIHRINNKFGIMIDPDGIRFGVYKEQKTEITLKLNELVTYPFSLENEAQYWVLRAYYSQY